MVMIVLLLQMLIELARNKVLPALSLLVAVQPHLLNLTFFNLVRYLLNQRTLLLLADRLIVGFRNLQSSVWRWRAQLWHLLNPCLLCCQLICDGARRVPVLISLSASLESDDPVVLAGGRVLLLVYHGYLLVDILCEGQ